MWPTFSCPLEPPMSITSTLSMFQAPASRGPKERRSSSAFNKRGRQGFTGSTALVLTSWMYLRFLACFQFLVSSELRWPCSCRNLADTNLVGLYVSITRTFSILFRSKSRACNILKSYRVVLYKKPCIH